MYFQRNRYVLNRSLNVPTKFGEDRSNSKEVAAVFEIQDGGGHLELWLRRYLDFANVF